MAKKNESISFEKKLENALVSDWEQPYKVPSNWIWTRLGEVCHIENGYAFKSSDYDIKGIPLLRISNIQNNTIDFSDCVYIKKSVDERLLVRKGDLLIALSGATTGKNGVYPFDEYSVLNQRVGNIKVINENILLHKYRNFFIEEKTKDIFKHAYGGAQPNISPKDICNFLFPLPPIAEQQRIVKRIENLFSKLNEAKDKALNALESFENRKATILHKAFTGELTKKWREENGLSLDSWSTKEFSEVAKIKSNLVQPSDYMDDPHIAPDNIEKKTGVLLDYNTIAEDGVTSGKHRFYAGQILYSKIRPYLSKVVIVDFDGLCSADMYPIEANENVKYLWYYMLSDTFLEQASNAGSRSVLPKINQKELSKIRVSMCIIEEQDEIVRILDSIFEKEQKAKELLNVIEKIDLMKKAILARALRGDLGTNNPEDKSAIEPLKRIISEENRKEKEQKPNKKSITISNSISKQFKTDLEEQIYRVILENPNSTLNQILSWISSSKHLDAMEVITVLYENGLIDKKDDLYSTN